MKQTIHSRPMNHMVIKRFWHLMLNSKGYQCLQHHTTPKIISATILKSEFRIKSKNNLKDLSESTNDSSYYLLLEENQQSEKHEMQLY